eukprot:5807890-Prymnesium_polylepis.2
MSRARIARIHATYSDKEEAEVQEALLWLRTHEAAGATLKRHMLGLGGLWVKFGQYMATRADVVPAALGKEVPRDAYRGHVTHIGAT